MKRFLQRFIGHKKNEVEERGNVPKEFGTTILHFACANNIYDIIKTMLNEGVDVNTVDNFGFTPLHLACDREAVDIVRMLLKVGADVNIPTSKGETAIHIACDKGNLEIVRMLLKYGADASKKTVRGDSPLNVACRHRNIELARLLLDNGAAQSEEGRVDVSPLRYACESGDINMVELLLEKIPELSADRALHLACEGRNYYLVEALLDRGADINAVGAFGQTPLRVACNRRTFYIIKLLIERNADLDIADIFGVTPLKSIIRSFGEVSIIQLVDMFEIVALLVDNFADLSALPNNREDSLVSMLLQNSGVRVRARVALHIQDVDELKYSLRKYYREYIPEYDHPLKVDLSNLSRVKSNLDKLEEMKCFVNKLKVSRDYVQLERKFVNMIGDENASLDKMKYIRNMLNVVDEFCKDVNSLRNTKIVESVILPMKKMFEDVKRK